MPNVTRMNSSLRTKASPSHPQTGGSGAGEPVQSAFDFSSNRQISEHIDDVYRAMRAAVEIFGGVTAMAAFVERDLADVSKRIAREQDGKGNLKQAFLDYIGVLGTDPAARKVFLFALCDAWGFKHPEETREPTTEEKYRALISRLVGSTAGEAILRDAAEAAGFDAGVFRR